MKCSDLTAAALLLLALPCARPAAAQAPADSLAVRIAFVGDILLDASVGRTIAANGVHYPWRDARIAFEGADLVVGNLEMAIAEGGVAENKQFTFRAHPRVLAGPIEAGVDLVSLANNHSLDYGAEGLLETLANLRSRDLPYVGAGADAAEAHRPHIVEIDGLRIGFLGFSRVYPYAHWPATRSRPGVASGYDYALETVFGAVERTRPLVDALVVLVHWGSELADHPRDIDVAFADSLMARGVTAVIGSHPHVLQGVDWRDEGVIAYSLGNFVFGSHRETTRLTGVLYLTLGAGGAVEAVEFLPMMIENGRPLLVSGDDAGNVLSRVRQLSRGWDTLVLADGRITTPRRALARVRFPLLRLP